jgi:hypothetical protein
MLTYAHVCSRMLTYAHVCSRMLTDDYAKGKLWAPKRQELQDPSEQVLSLLALLVQKYKYWLCRRAGIPCAQRARGFNASVYLLYWYKSTNLDAVGEQGFLPLNVREDSMAGDHPANEVLPWDHPLKSRLQQAIEPYQRLQRALLWP